MSRKLTIKEVYFYKKKDTDLYTVDFIDAKNRHLHKELSNLTRTEVSEVLEKIRKDKHPRYLGSKKGMTVYNKYPESILSHSSSRIVNVYLENLKDLQESKESRELAANLLRAAADLLSYEDQERLDMLEPEPTGIIPNPASNTIVPFEVIDKVQSDLEVAINFSDLTFYFNSQKWQLQKDIDTNVSSIPKRPKSSNTIITSMDYMKNLLGVNGENSLDPNSLYFRFTLKGEVYKISHIYTSDHNTLTRD